LVRALDLPHRAYDFNCMMSGLESLAEKELGIRLTDRFLFAASFIGFGYESGGPAKPIRRVLPGSGIGRGQYAFLAPVFGFEWSIREGLGFDRAWEEIRALVESGSPAVIGEIDMFHLPYLRKFYHRIHVPDHYATVVGYDDGGREALILDCGRPEVARVGLKDLERAMDVGRFGAARSNTFYSFRFDAAVKGIDARDTVARILRSRGEAYLDPGSRSEGLAALRCFIADLPSWERDMSPRELDASLRYMASHTCSAAPMPPRRLARFPVDPRFESHRGLRDVFAGLLRSVGAEYSITGCAEAAELFDRSGNFFQSLTDEVSDYAGALIKTGSAREALDRAAKALADIARIEEKAFGLLARIA
jgi:hypothetical protein